MAAALFSVIFSPDPLHSFSHGIKSIAMKRVSARMGDNFRLKSKLNCQCKYFLGQLHELAFNSKKRKWIFNHDSFVKHKLPYVWWSLARLKRHRVLCVDVDVLNILPRSRHLDSWSSGAVVFWFSVTSVWKKWSSSVFVGRIENGGIIFLHS